MATAESQAPPMSADTPRRLRPEIDRIIRAGKQPDVARGSFRPVMAVTGMSSLLLWASFTPLDIAALAWVALVPLCLLLRVRLLPKHSYSVITLCGFVWAVATLQWMRLGHVTMYGALLALSVYLALYLPVFVAIGRVLVAHRWPVWLAVPVIWTALEFVRAYLLTGFSWYYLGHTQYRWTSLVQIADLAGAYGVSFLVALGSASLAALISPRMLVRLKLAESKGDLWPVSQRSRITGVSLTIGLVAAACVYGVVRMQPVDKAIDGPVVAIVQGNFTPELKHDPNQWVRMVNDHDLLTRRAATLRPELIVWPETMFPVPNQIVADDLSDDDLISRIPLDGRATNRDLAERQIQQWRSGYARTLLSNRSQEAGAAMLVGMITEVATTQKIDRYNSAAFIRPDLGFVDRYDKRHRVIFGEYIPLRSVLPWLAELTPFGSGFGIDAGEEAAIFEYQGTRYAPIICFEDTVPQLVRRTVMAQDNSGRSPDVLINLTNDGWFRGSSELDQHLITATFRCIETRRPMVRAVNAGISAMIDSSGRIRQPEQFWLMQEDTAGVVADFDAVDSLINPQTGQRYRQCSAVMCGQIPLDGRSTVYMKFGDWFAILCATCTVVALISIRMRRTELDPAS
ncbi:MAG: apolipoprotein N-acyltransferase [Planctomycetaceae bacterium]